MPRRVDSPPEGAASTLDAFERFLFDEIDGRRTLAELADAVTIDVEATRQKIDRLVERGLVAWLDAPASTSVPRPSPAANVEVEPERRARIDLIHAALTDLTHYDLLGVPPDADKALFKKAYFSLSKEFHPDTQFGKQLGAYKSKMEVIFRHLTEAHDVVTRPKRKAEYDEALAAKGKKPFSVRLHPRSDPTPAAATPAAAAAPAPATPAPASPAASSSMGPASPFAATIVMTRPAELDQPSPTAPPPVHATPLPGANTATRRAFRVSVPGTSDAISSVPPSPMSAPAPASPARADAPPAVPASRPVSSSRPPTVPTAASAATSERLAREIARQTGHAPITPPPQARPSVQPSAEPGPRDDKALFRAIAGASQVTGRVDRLEHYVHLAHAHEAKGDLVEALSCAKLALGFDPSRADTRVLYQRLESAVATTQAESFRERAKADERSRRFDLASSSWARVCLGLPDDLEAHLGAARCLLEWGGDLRRARDYAQRAVDIAPTSVPARVVLARIFHAAGMRLNATRELEAAAKLDPASQLVKTLQRELK